MDPELRVNFLLLLRPVMLLDEEYLYEALEVAREAYILTTGNLSEFCARMPGISCQCDGSFSFIVRWMLSDMMWHTLLPLNILAE